MVLLMAEILHQLRLVVYPIIDRVLYIQTVMIAGFLPIIGSEMEGIHSNKSNPPNS